MSTHSATKKEIPKKINRDRVQSVRLPNETFVVLLERVEPVTLEIRVSEQLLAQISEPLN